MQQRIWDNTENLTQTIQLRTAGVGVAGLLLGLILPVPGQVSDLHVYQSTFLGRNLTSPDKRQD